MNDFSSRGIRPVAISVDASEVSHNLCQSQGYTFTFLSDPQTEVIRRYDLLHAHGRGDQDIARPAEFLLDSTGTVRWANFSESVFVRATPQQILQAFSSIQ